MKAKIAHLMSNLWIAMILQQETAFQASWIHGETGKLDSIRLVKSNSKMLSTHPVWWLRFPQSSDFRKVPIPLFNAGKLKALALSLLRLLSLQACWEAGKQACLFTLGFSRLFSDTRKVLFHLYKTGDKKFQSRKGFPYRVCYKWILVLPLLHLVCV